MNREILILGGGVIGVSTALMFHALGYKVGIVSRQFLWEDSNDPSFASVYPAASVIPHTVGGNTKKLYEVSSSVFCHISRSQQGAVRRQKHLELTEGMLDAKEYFDWMKARPVSTAASLWGVSVPKRNSAARVEGVGMDIFFVEMPSYITYLEKAVERHQIETVRREIDRTYLDDLLRQEIIVCNCLGLNGPDLVEDNAKMEAVAGVLVRCPLDELLMHDETNTPVSYNYFFDDREVYSYPRLQNVIFGGIRVAVNRLKDPATQLKAHFEESNIGYRLIDSIPVPHYLIEVNKEITSQLYGIDVPMGNAEALIGLRPVRKNGVRLDAAYIGSSILINNYGYGGAGVTLSWGAAIKAAQLAGETLNEGILVEKLLEALD